MVTLTYFPSRLEAAPHVPAHRDVRHDVHGDAQVVAEAALGTSWKPWPRTVAGWRTIRRRRNKPVGGAVE